MARREVDLVIRAKDEAARALNSVTKALDALKAGQAGVSQGASKTESALGKLGAVVASLEKTFNNGAGAAEKSAKGLDTATKAANRLDAAAGAAALEFAKLAEGAIVAAANTARLKTESSAAALAVDKETAALVKAKAAVVEHNQKLREAVRERDNLTAADARLTSQIAKQTARVQAATARQDKLQATPEADRGAGFADRLIRSTAATDAAKAKLAELSASLVETRAKFAALAGAVPAATAAVAESTSALTRQVAALADAKQSYANLNTAVRAAVTGEKELAASASKAGTALTAARADAAQAATALKDLRTTAASTSATMTELSSGAAAQFTTALAATRRTTLEAKREWAGAEVALKQLAQEMVRIGPPTRAQAIAWNAAGAAARAAKAEYEIQREALNRLSAITRETGGDIDTLRDRLNRFSATQTDATARAKAAREAIAAQAAAYQRLAVEAATASARSAGGATAAAGPLSVAPVNGLAAAYRSLYGETRLAMSWTQRLRGEVLSLVAAYGGIFAVVSVLGKTITAFQTLEAATSRLNAVFNGNKLQTAAEFDFLRRTADRLGVSLGDLSNEYSKFSIATQGTVLQGQKTRDIFLAVTEAARVNKASTEDLKGIFVALTQIVSKGSVQMEELRQQLGDRLPGAIQIMAAGLGVTTDALIKMMEQGQVSSTALVQFSEELNKRFSAQLPDALKSTTAEMGRFQNSLFQALTTFGEAGFLRAFTDLLRTLNAVMKTTEFESFSARASRAFAALTDAVRVLVENFRTVIVIAGAFVGIRLIPFFVGVAAAVGAAVASTRAATVSFVRFGAVAASTTAAVASTTGVMAAAGVAARGLAASFAALFSSTGLGLIVVAVSAGLTYWTTRTDDATAAMSVHRRVVEQVQAAYDKAGKSTEGFAEEVKKISLTQAEQSLAGLQKKLEEVRNSVPALASFSGRDSGIAAEIEKLRKAFQSGKLSAEDYKKAIDKIAQDNPRLNRGLALSILEAADSAIKLEQQVARADAVVKLIKDSSDPAARAVLGLGDAFNRSNLAILQGADNLKKYTDAITKLKEAIPGLADELQRTKDLAAIEAAYREAIKNAISIGQVYEADRLRKEAIAALDTKQYEEANKALASFTDGVQAAAELLRRREGFIANPKVDNDGRLRVGFGSDTVTLTDGSVKAVTAGIAVSVADANRDLYRRIALVQDALKDAIGAARFGQLTPAQQGVLTSIAYNYGTGALKPGGSLGDLVEAVKTGTTAGVAAAIRRRSGDNDGINRGRRNEEAAIFEGGTGTKEQTQAFIAEQERAKKAAEAKAQKEKEFRESQAAGIAQTRFELSLEDENIVKKQVALELRKAELAAKEAGTTLTQKERDAIIQVTTEKYKQQKIDDEIAARKTAATEAEEAVTNLTTRREQLEKQIAIHRASGNTEGVVTAKAAIAEINKELSAAIDNAIKMWEAVGGGAALAAIEKLKLAKLEAAGLSAKAKTAIVDWKQVADVFASTVSNAFDKFAQSVQSGTDIGIAARDAFLSFASDFLRQIAQMIIKQLALNAAKAALSAFGIPVGHTGGLVGSKRIGGGNGTRSVDSGLFSAAARYHSGGVVGLRPNEVPAILKKNEEVLTEDDPRHILNGGYGAAAREQQGGSGGVNLKVINALSAEDILTAGVDTRAGERVLLNFIRANAGAVKAAING